MTDDDKTPDPTPALMSAARLAEIRERARLGSLPHVAELLAHLDALTPRAVPIDREAGGRLVREVWIAWAREQPSPKPSWLVPWEGLSEPDREVDRRIFEACYAAGRASLAPCEVDGEALGRDHYLRLHGAELCASVWPTLPAEVRARFVAAAIALYQRGRAAGRSEGEAERARLQGECDNLKIERDHYLAEKNRVYREEAACTAEISRLTAELATIADRMKRTEGAQAQLDRALASCETYRAEIERLTSSLRTETTMKEQVQDELVAMRLKRREEWERAERLTAELAEVQATRLSGAREEREAIRADVLDRRASTDDDRRWHAFDYVVRMLDARGEGGGR